MRKGTLSEQTAKSLAILSSLKPHVLAEMDCNSTNSSTNPLMSCITALVS